MKGGDTMTEQQVKDKLEKQLQLRSERSRVCIEDRDLVGLTDEMVNIAKLLLRDS